MKKKKTDEELNNEENVNEIEKITNKSKKRKEKVEANLETEVTENIEATENEEDFLEEAIKEVQEELEVENNLEEIDEEDIQIQDEENLTDETNQNKETLDDVSIKNDKEDKKSENIFSKRVEIPLVGLILTVLLIITAIISLIIFKDRIFNFKSNNNNNNEVSIDNKLNEKEQIGYELISKWLDNYKNGNSDISNKILSYNITSTSLTTLKNNKFIILATYDVVPASKESSFWLQDNGEKEGDVIRNKLQYFTIEQINDKYEIINSGSEKLDINYDGITKEKVIISIKNEFPDPESLNLMIDSSVIDALTPEKKSEVNTKVGSLDDYFKITGSYRQTYILGTILVNKNTQEKYFVNVEGEVFKLEKVTQILNLADFEVQGDLMMTLDQAILVTFNYFPKNKRQGLTLVENWLDTIENRLEVESKLGNSAEYYALKTNTSKGYILVKKNGLGREFVSLDGTITNLEGIDDITTIIQ